MATSRTFETAQAPSGRLKKGSRYWHLPLFGHHVQVNLGRLTGRALFGLQGKGCVEGSGTWRVKPAETAANLTRSRNNFLMQRYWEWKRCLFSALEVLRSENLDLVNKQR